MQREINITGQLLEASNNGDFFDRTTLNIKPTDAEFNEIFGKNMKEKYKQNFEVVAGRLVYKTDDPIEIAVLKEKKMTITAVPSTMAIGDAVAYTPSGASTYAGKGYAKDSNNIYAETTQTYWAAPLTSWVYLGQDENGNVLLTSSGVGYSFNPGSGIGYVTSPNRLNEVCNALYGNSEYGTARNMTIEDVNMVLDVTPTTPITIKAKEAEQGSRLTNRQVPTGYTKSFDNSLLNYYYITGTNYKANTTKEYRIIFNGSATSTTSLAQFWLSSNFINADFSSGNASFGLRIVRNGAVASYALFDSDGTERQTNASVRPVIVLSNSVQIGPKNNTGAWTLINM